MKFSKELLKELVYEYPGGGYGGCIVIEREMIGQRRWVTEYTQVFQYEGKFYRTNFDMGSTEMQDGEPYEYEDDEIELKEVFAHDETVTRYY